MKMPFGKHKGIELEDCPKQYLHWLCQQDWMKGELLEECEEIVGDWTPPVRGRKYIVTDNLDSMFFDIAAKHGGLEFDHMVAEYLGDYSHLEDDGY